MGAPDQRDRDLTGAGTSAAGSFPRPLRAILAAMWGLATGVICLAVGFAAGTAAAFAVPPAPGSVQSCGEDEVVCLPDLRPLIVGLVVIAVVIPVVSPLVAWILRLPRPWYFLLPGLWVGALAVDALTVSVLSHSLPVDLVLALAPYALLAMWTVTRATNERSSP